MDVARERHLSDLDPLFLSQDAVKNLRETGLIAAPGMDDGEGDDGDASTSLHATASGDVMSRNFISSFSVLPFSPIFEIGADICSLFPILVEYNTVRPFFFRVWIHRRC